MTRAPLRVFLGSLIMAKKLFIPGPSEVGPKMLGVLATPQIGHRSGEFQELPGQVAGRMLVRIRGTLSVLVDGDVLGPLDVVLGFRVAL